jgi:hypothetical protein
MTWLHLARGESSFLNSPVKAATAIFFANGKENLLLKRAVFIARREYGLPMR